MVEWYTESHLTLREIAKLSGCTHAAVAKRLRKVGVTSQQGEWVETWCAYCGRPMRKPRGRWRKRMRSFCGVECYFAALEQPRYRPWRQGSRLARAVVALHFALEPDHVVHHRDGDSRNNDRANLVVFASQAEHMAHHRGRQVTPLWDGADDS